MNRETSWEKIDLLDVTRNIYRHNNILLELEVPSRGPPNIPLTQPQTSRKTPAGADAKLAEE